MLMGGTISNLDGCEQEMKLSKCLLIQPKEIGSNMDQTWIKHGSNMDQTNRIKHGVEVRSKNLGPSELHRM